MSQISPHFQKSRLFLAALVASLAVAGLLLRRVGPRLSGGSPLSTPSAIPPTTQPAGLSLTPPATEVSTLPLGTPLVYVSDGGRVYALDPTSHAVVRAISIPNPGKPLLSPDGREVYVPEGRVGKVSILDALSGQVIGRLAPSGWPGGVAFSPHGQEVYVTEINYGRLLIIDRASRLRKAAIKTGQAPGAWYTGADTRGVVVTPYGGRAYVVNTRPATVAVIDLVERRLMKEIPLGEGATDDLGPVAISPDGQRVYVLQPRARPVIWAVETATQEAEAFPLELEGQPSDIAVSPDGRLVYVTGRGPAGGLLILNSMTLRQLAWLGHPDGYDQVTVTPDGKWVYLVSAGEGQLTVVDASSRRVAHTLSLRPRRHVAEGALEAPGKILFISERTGTPALYLMNPDGTNQTKLAPGSSARWSPDGSQILFQGRGGYVFDPEERTLKQVYSLYVMRTDGSDQTQVLDLAEIPALSFEGYAWSPDGSKVALLATRDANGNGEWDRADRSALYLLPRDGEPIEVLETGPPPVTRLRWSPRGDLIALGWDWESSGEKEVYLVAVDEAVLAGTGGELQRLAQGRSFTWSPDGRRLAFVDRTGTAVQVIDVDHPGEPQLLYADSRPKYNLTWSSDGRYIAYVVREESDGGTRYYSVYVLSLETGRSLPVAEGDEALRYFGPSWSPDSRYVAFVGVEVMDGKPDWLTSEIYVAAVDGSFMAQLTSDASPDLSPLWSP